MINNAPLTGTALLLNFAPIDFEDVQLNLGYLTYRDKEQLETLRTQYKNTHFFHKERGGKILSVPLVTQAPFVGEYSEVLNLKSKLDLCAALVRESLKNHLFTLEREIIQHDPLSFVASRSDDDLFAVSVSQLHKNFANFDWLQAPIVYDVSTRILNLDHQNPLLGLHLNLRTIRRILKPCNELLEEGFPLINLYVARKANSSDWRIAPHLEVLGRVKSISGTQLILDDFRSGFDRVEASQVFLEARNENFDHCLTHIFHQDAVAVKAKLELQLASVRSGPNKLNKLQTVINFLAKRNIEILPKVPITIQGFLDEDEGDTFPQLQKAHKPTYIFNPKGDYTHSWNDGGLNKYGPYTSQTFTPSNLHVAVICQSNRKGSVDQFLHKFFNGVGIKVKNYEPYAKGFIRKYMLEGFTLEFFQVSGSSPEAYKKAALQSISYQTEHNRKWDIVLVQTEQHFNELQKSKNPYLVTKAIFLQHQLPVQAFEIESAEVPDQQLVYVLNNMALATYAKLNGIPWMLKANPTISHELVIGLGSAQIGDGRFGDKQRIVGITTVFSSDGHYWLSNLSRAVRYEEYKDELLNSLKTTISRIEKDMNWQQGDHIRLVFHIFKPLKETETEAVKTLMKEFTLYDTEFAFLHIVQDHPIVLFDKNQQGIWDYETKSSGKGKMAPARGTFFHLSRVETLLALTGPNEVKRSQDGLPQPVLLRLQKGSTFTDMTYLTKQVFAFSCHSWRSFSPASMPVTILYSDRVAKLLGQMEGIPGWSPDALVGRIGRTRWFL